MAGAMHEGKLGEASRASKQWLVLAIMSLIVAGLQSLLLVVGRLPPVTHLFSDPLFFRRALVVHVNLALLVWFLSLLLALFFLLPGARRLSFPSRASATVAAIGVVTFVAAAGAQGAAPVLSNYIPVVDHPLFFVGLSLFGLGAILGAFDRRVLPGNDEAAFYAISAAPAAGVRAGVIALLLAALTFLGSLVSTPRTMPESSYYELMLWGGGHVLQFAHVAGMTAVWLLLLESALGRPAVSYRVASLLYGVLVAPLFAAPLLALQGPISHTTFTLLMRWGIFPVVVTFIVLCARSLHRAHAQGRDLRQLLTDPRVLAFVASAFLTLTGFVLGAFIRGSTTLIPAHYHASIGAVTVVYMAFAYRMLERFGMPIARGAASRIAAIQPAVFGFGQLVFAVGFALAGAHGMARKAYGTEQHVRTFAESAGLLIMGLGGAVAVVAGIAFLVITSRAWLASVAHKAKSEGDTRWKNTSIRSRG